MFYELNVKIRLLFPLLTIFIYNNYVFKWLCNKEGSLIAKPQFLHIFYLILLIYNQQITSVQYSVSVSPASAQFVAAAGSCCQNSQKNVKVSY